MGNTSVFKSLAPRMMRDLMRDFAPLADFQAAGIVGNGGGESGGFSIAQELHPTSGRGGLGGFQWTGQRRVQYESYITEHGGNPTHDALNYDFMYGMLKRELEGPERASILAVRQTRDVTEATKMFMVKFERPGVPHYEGRVRWSQMALDAYRAEEGQIAKNPDVQVAKEPAKLPMPPAIPKSEADTKGAAKTVAAGGIGASIIAFFGSTWLHVALFIGIAVAVWWFLIRPVVIRFTALGDIEANFFTKVRVALKGIKTKLFAGILGIAGVAAPVVSWATDTNLLDALPTIKGIPGNVYGLGIVSVIGLIVNWLRNQTTTAPGQTDLAIIPPPAPNEVMSITDTGLPPVEVTQLAVVKGRIKSAIRPEPEFIPIGKNNLKAFNEVRLSQTKKRRQSNKKKAA